MKISPRNYICYKGVNSFFTGLTVGAVFTIYGAIEPSIFSMGGVLLAFGMLVVAKFYGKILNINSFFKISVFVEIVMLLLILLYLISPYNYLSALLIYAGYQLIFMFGSYLVRAETIFLYKKRLLSWLDMAKQTGYLAGMLLSWFIYKGLEYFYQIYDKNTQVYYIHSFFLLTQLVVVYLLLNSFKREPKL